MLGKHNILVVDVLADKEDDQIIVIVLIIEIQITNSDKVQHFEYLSLATFPLSLLSSALC